MPVETLVMGFIGNIHFSQVIIVSIVIALTIIICLLGIAGTAGYFCRSPRAEFCSQVTGVILEEFYCH